MPRPLKPKRIAIPDVDYAAGLQKVFGDNPDRVSHPSHYTWLKELCGIEVIDITRHMDFDLGNAIKYVLRNGRKSEEGLSDIDKAIEDLHKAVWYINDKIQMLENQKNRSNVPDNL